LKNIAPVALQQGFQATRNAFPDLGADVTRYAAQFKRLLGHCFLEALQPMPSAITRFVAASLASAFCRR
jgi:hypothetical protein